MIFISYKYPLSIRNSRFGSFNHKAVFKENLSKNEKEWTSETLKYMAKYIYFKEQKSSFQKTVNKNIFWFRKFSKENLNGSNI